MFPQLGVSLRRHPDAAEVLLRVVESHPVNQRDFAREVFRHAGTEMLPRLYAALQDEEPVVRANAARACGAIGQPESLALMLEAMAFGDKETCLGVVEGLCFFNSPDALKVLVEIYVTADEQTAAIREEVARLWQTQGINNPAVPQPLVEARNKMNLLLLPRDICNAAYHMEIDWRQRFYGLLSRASSLEGRQATLHALTVGREWDIGKNVAIFQGLLDDPDATIRMRAAVALLNLGNSSGEDTIRQGLEGPGEMAKEAAVTMLRLVKEPSRRSFAAPFLTQIVSDASVSAELRARAAGLLHD